MCGKYDYFMLFVLLKLNDRFLIVFKNNVSNICLEIQCNKETLYYFISLSEKWLPLKPFCLHPSYKTDRVS